MAGTRGRCTTINATGVAHNHDHQCTDLARPFTDFFDLSSPPVAATSPLIARRRMEIVDHSASFRLRRRQNVCDLHIQASNYTRLLVPDLGHHSQPREISALVGWPFMVASTCIRARLRDSLLQGVHGATLTYILCSSMARLVNAAQTTTDDAVTSLVREVSATLPTTARTRNAARTTTTTYGQHCKSRR